MTREALLRIFDLAEDRPDIREVARVALAVSGAVGNEERLREAAEAVLERRQRYLEAANRAGHPGVEHDDWLRYGDDPPSPAVYGDCSACAGAEYGTESDLNDAYDDLRAVLASQSVSESAPSAEKTTAADTGRGT